MSKRGIMGVVLFTFTANGKKSDGTQAELMFMGELIYKYVSFTLFWYEAECSREAATFYIAVFIKLICCISSYAPFILVHVYFTIKV